MFPLLQIFLLIFSTVLFHMGISNPNPNSTGDHIPYEGVGVTFMVFFGPKLAKLLIWASTFYQVLYLYLQAFPQTSISTLFPQMLTCTNLLPLTTVSVFGHIFMIIGGAGRVWCYRTLGRFFTFNLTIRNSHKLIKAGPYRYVRHPSYTFGIILTLGMFLVHQRLTNFFPDSRWPQIMFGPVGLLMSCISLVLILTKRVPQEEDELRKTFGKKWTDYAAKTKRFIPGVI